jgi:gliding motility-associated lipoprotein GldD
MQNKWAWIFGAFLIFSGCEEETPIPKPAGYYRLDYPEHAFQTYSDENCPYSFQFGALAKIEKVEAENQNCWFNVVYPGFKSKIHFSYYPISRNDLSMYTEDSRKLAMKHLVKADDFGESYVRDTATQVYGTIYDFRGKAASNFQFFLTDSATHFVRGALYFEVEPNADSLAPAEHYIEEELMHLIQTFSWK